jgi:hypothetical protein
MPDEQHDRAGQQRFTDPAPGGPRLPAHHDEGEHEHGDDGGLRREVPGGDGDQGAAQRHQGDQPGGAREERREPGEEDGAEHGPRRPADHA